MPWLARVAWPFVLKYVKTLLAKKAAKIAVAKITAYLKKKAKK